MISGVANEPVPAAEPRQLHIRCGSDIRETLSAAAILGDFLEFADPVCRGPVPANVDAAELHRLRGRFIAESWRQGTAADCQARLEREWAGLADATSYDRVILWFEHDLYDQAILIRLLDHFRDLPALHGCLYLLSTDHIPGVDRFVGYGQLDPAQLAGLIGQERAVTADMFDLAARAWRAFRDPDPSALAALAAKDLPSLPYLAAAMRRHLQELPWTDSGLSLTRRLTLRAVADGADTPGRAFHALHTELEDRPFLGDLMYWSDIEALTSAPRPALTPAADWRDAIALTEFGRALLAGEADWIAENGVDRWCGGVHLQSPGPVWRWDAATDGVVRG